MLIKIFDYKGIAASHIIGNAQFAVNTEEKRALIFLPDQEIDFSYYKYKLNGNDIFFFLYENKDAFEKSLN